MGKTQVRTLKVSQICMDSSTQARVDTDDGVVQEYAELMKDGHHFPPIEVIHERKTGKYYLVDGWHRMLAAKEIKLATLGAIVSDGTLEEARWQSAGANKNHGLRRTSADKRKAARTALMARPDLTDSVLAQHIGVCGSMVSKYRKELQDAGVLNPVDVRVGLDGRKMTAAGLAARAEAIKAANAKRHAGKPKYTHCPTCRGSGMVKAAG